MSDWYILNEDHSIRKANDTPDDTNLAYRDFEGNHKIVAQEHVGAAWVSTVFLGLDHSWVDTGPPIVFETMVFRDGNGEECFRYSTWQEAMEGHGKVCRELNSGLTREELEAAKQVIEGLLSADLD